MNRNVYTRFFWSQWGRARDGKTVTTALPAVYSMWIGQCRGDLKWHLLVNRNFRVPKCDVNPQPNARGIGPLVGITSGDRRSVMHVLVDIFSITYNFSFICQYICLTSCGWEIFPLLKYPGKFLIFEWTKKILAHSSGNICHII